MSMTNSLISCATMTEEEIRDEIVRMVSKKKSIIATFESVRSCDFCLLCEQKSTCK